MASARCKIKGILRCKDSLRLRPMNQISCGTELGAFRQQSVLVQESGDGLGDFRERYSQGPVALERPDVRW